MKFYVYATLILSNLLLTHTSVAQVSQNFFAEEQPKWEFGLGAIALNRPDYPGASNNTFRFIPFPFGIYRGDILRIDDEGTRARLQTKRRWEIGLSFGLNFPVKSADNDERLGMPDLDTILELGPRFLYRFLTDSPYHQLNLSFSVRGAMSTDFGSSTKGRGYVFQPELKYWRRFPEWRTTFITGLELYYATQSLNEYFYTVNSNFITGQRPGFRAEAGLVEASVFVGGMYTINKKVSVFCGGSYSDLSLAKNRQSPLVSREENFSGIVGFVWNFYQSKEMVPVRNQTADL